MLLYQASDLKYRQSEIWFLQVEHILQVSVTRQKTAQVGN